MKSIICRLARRHLDPGQLRSRPGWLARHANTCQGCRRYFEQVRTLEESLRRDPPPADPERCGAIMRAVQATSDSGDETVAAVTLRRRALVVVAGGLAAAAALAIAVVALTDPGGDEQADHASPPVPPARAPGPEPGPDPGNTTPSLAQVMQQQELLQRDARKLGAHLRERVILFRPVN